MSSDPNQVNKPEQPDAEARSAKRSGDSLLSTIQEMQSRFDALKRAHEESEQRELDLAGREAAAATMEAEIRRRDEQSATLRAEIEAARSQSREWAAQAAREREEIQRLRAEAESGARTVAELESQLSTREREIAAKAEQAAARAQQIEESWEAVRKLEEGLAEREHVVAEQDKKIAERERRAADDEKKNSSAEFRLAEQRQNAGRELALLGEREKQFAAREEKLSASEVELETLKKRFAEQAVRVAEREAEFEESQKALAARGAELHAEAQRLDEARRQVATRAQELETRVRAAEEAERRAAERAEELAGAEETFAQREQVVAQLETAAAQRERAVVERELAASGAASDVEGQQKVLAELEEQLRRREQQVAETIEQAAQREREANQRQEQHTRAMHEAREDINLAREELDARDVKMREAEAALRQRQAEVRKHADEVERNRAAVAEQAKTLTAASSGDVHHGGAIHSGRTEQIQIQLGEANARRAATETELAQSKREIARLVDELRSLTAAVAKAKESARAEVERRGVALTDLESELETARREAHEQAERAERAEKQAAGTIAPERLAEQTAMVNRLRAELKEATEVNESMRRRAEEASEHGNAGDGSAAAAQLAERDRAIEELTQRLEEAEFKAMQVAEELESARAAGVEETAPSGTAAVASAPSHARRERLRRYKSLLQSQARKIVTAQTALQKRHTDCEQVLAQRARLAGVAADVAKREKKLAAAAGRSGAAAAVLYAVATLAILAVMSWQVAARVWPGTYVASAVFEADTHGRTPNENELATWQNYHTELLDNPALIEMAAERMARRGLASYGSPAELRSKLKKDLYHQSSTPGELTIELKHEGADKAKLVLDTLVTSIKSVSDAQRDQRPDDLGVLIAQTATAGTRPLNDNQFENAGMVLGGAALAAALFGMVVWSRLARAKHKFEHAQAVEAALNEVDWSAMEQSMKRSQPSGAAEKEGKPASKKRRNAA